MKQTKSNLMDELCIKIFEENLNKVKSLRNLYKI